jgi:DNA repair protein SbcD/Mre11
MRIVHTSDWHAGRLWKGINRLSELEAVLDNLAIFLERERIDLLLLTGDIFEGGGRSAEAERLVFSFLKRVGQAGVHTVAIAGNHDNPVRVEAWGTLAELVQVRALGFPRRREKGGVVEIIANGERALVAAVPFAQPGHVFSALDLAGDEGLAAQRYADGMRAIFEHLSTAFDRKAINLVMAHTHVTGAVLAAHDRSERGVYLGEEWAVTPQALPATAQYVALGHIHKPQRVDAAPAPTYYAGSPMQLDFGEAGEEKSFLVIEATPRKPVRVERIPYEGARPLVDVRMTVGELQRDADRLRGLGHLRITVPLDGVQPDVNREIRNLLPNAVSVAIDVAEVAETPSERLPAGSPPHALFAAYYRRTHGSEPHEATLAEFDRLLDVVSKE